MTLAPGSEHVVSWRASIDGAGGAAYVYLAGAGDAALGLVRGARLIDVVPTIAAWLPLLMPSVDGRSLFP